MPKRAPMGGAGGLAASHHAVITRTQAAQFGLTAAAVRSLRSQGVLDEPVPGVLVFTGAPATCEQRLAVASSVANHAGVVSFRSAARLQRVDGFDRFDGVEITVIRGTKIRLPGVVRHQVLRALPPEDVKVLDGLRCTSLARTLVDLASVLESDELERALDDFERRRFSLNWLEMTAARLHRPGQSGTKRILAEVAARRRRGRVRDSWFEKLVELCLASARIPPLARQYVLRDEAGRFVARFDLAIPSARLAIEAHSRAHHTGPQNEASDERRDRRAAEQGYEIVYLGYAETTQTPEEVRSQIERIVSRRMLDLGLALPPAM